MVMNLWFVLLAGVAGYVVGSLWFTVLFGKTWSKLQGFTKTQIEETKKKGMVVGFIVQFIGTVLMAYVLAFVIKGMGVSGFVGGMGTGIAVWFGFQATIMLGMVLWEKKPFRLYLINVTNYLVAMAIMGGIIAAWA